MRVYLNESNACHREACPYCGQERRPRRKVSDLPVGTLFSTKIWDAIFLKTKHGAESTGIAKPGAITPYEPFNRGNSPSRPEKFMTEEVKTVYGFIEFSE